MSLKPIDLQTNIGQMHEVAKNQQAKNESIVQQQYLRDNEATEKSNKADSRVEENKKGENDGIRRKGNQSEKKKNSDHHKRNDKNENKKEPTHVQYVDNSSLGRLIDIKK